MTRFSKRKFLSILRGRGKDDNETEDRYMNVLYRVLGGDADNPLTTYFKTFSSYASDPAFWGDQKTALKKLAEFTRFFLVSHYDTSSGFIRGAESFLHDITDSTEYASLLDTMDDLSDIEKKAAKDGVEDFVPEEFKEMKQRSIKAIERYAKSASAHAQEGDYNVLPVDNFATFILNCIIASCNSPSEVEKTYETYADKIAKYTDRDTLNVFSETLADTAASDDEESDESSDEDDQDFVVGDDEEIEVEPEEPKRKKLRHTEDDSSDEDEKGSGINIWF